MVGGCAFMLVGHTASQGELILLFESQSISRCKLEAMVVFPIRKSRDIEG
jgi:hypothetical protein